MAVTPSPPGHGSTAPPRRQQRLRAMAATPRRHLDGGGRLQEVLHVAAGEGSTSSLPQSSPSSRTPSSHSLRRDLPPLRPTGGARVEGADAELGASAGEAWRSCHAEAVEGAAAPAAGEIGARRGDDRMRRSAAPPSAVDGGDRRRRSAAPPAAVKCNGRRRRSAARLHHGILRWFVWIVWRRKQMGKDNDEKDMGPTTYQFLFPSRTEWTRVTRVRRRTQCDRSPGEYNHFPILNPE